MSRRKVQKPVVQKPLTERAGFGYPLNPEQQKAVTHGDGPLLIVAGAGTGKTAVITERVAWLIRSGKAKPEELLVLTFTEKAAAEMEERVDRLLPYGYVDVWISTFHAFGERMLREYGLEIGLDTKFRVLAAAEQWLLLRQHLDELQLQHYKPLGNPTRFLHALLTHFSRAKDEVVTPKEYVHSAARVAPPALQAGNAERENAEKTLEVARAYERYETLLRASGHLDFGDLIVQTLRLLTERPSVLAELRKKFRYILVDEFQDTNHAQYELVRTLTAPSNNLTVVGDDDQSIYKFRGAALSNILEFKKDFPQSAEVTLTQNYRSSQNILDLSYRFIQQNNPNRLEAQLNGVHVPEKGKPLATPISKKLVSDTKEQGTIRLFEAATTDDETRLVVEDILQQKRKHPERSWNEFAILVRANNHAEPFVRLFEQTDIPFQFVAARGLLARPEVLDLVSYLKLLDNYRESPALYRVLSMRQFGIHHRTVMDLLAHARRVNVSLFEAAEHSDGIASIKSSERMKLRGLLQRIRDHTEMTRTRSAGAVLYQFLQDVNYIDRFDHDSEAAKIQNVAKFYTLIRDFEERNDDTSVAAFVRELNLLLDVGEDPAPSGVLEGPESVKVMTVHGAKGLEFSHVYIVQCADKRFPTIEQRDAIPLPDALIKEIIPPGDAHLEEERRLFYVAMTRAKRSLTFTFARDYGGARAKKPSRFLYELGLVQQERRSSPHVSNTPLPKPLALPKQKGKIRYKLPAKFSFTQLKAFETCPKQYWYAHILAIPVVGRHTFSFGKTMHATLQKFFAEVQRGVVPTLPDLLAIYERSWIGEWYESKRHEQERQAAGEAALRQFYEREKDSFSIAPLFLEKGFNVRVGRSTVKGVIDRIDPLPEKGSEAVHIIDYKTGRVPKNAKDGLDQLVIYAIAAHDVLQLQPQQLTYYYLEEGAKVTHGFVSEDAEKTKRYVQELVARLKASDFRATPGFWCQFCDFKEICEDRQL